jgi:hypothetical protein
MAKSYVKNCDYRMQEIEMSDKVGGKWLPYSLNNGPHDCRTNGKGKTNGQTKQTKQSRLSLKKIS